MNISFSTTENKKAAIYTAIVCITLLLVFLLIKWDINLPIEPIVQDQIEINLGNEEEGFGAEQPLVKGNPTPDKMDSPSDNSPASNDNVDPDDNAEATAAPVVKNEKKKISPTPAPKNNKTEKQTNNQPKLTFKGPNTGPNGNNPTTDNGFTSQGNNPNGKGDFGSTNGKPKVIPINKAMLKDYKFEDELGAEKIYARINVSTSGVGSFVKIEKKSTSFESKYKTAIIKCLPKMKFETAGSDYQAVIIFDFRVN